MSQRNDSSNDSHLPECLTPMYDAKAWCICNELRDCEQRVREEWYEVQSETWVRGFDVGVRSAREERMKNDDDYAYVAAQAEADGRRRGWGEAISAAQSEVLSFLLDEETKMPVNWVVRSIADAIDTLAEAK